MKKRFDSELKKLVLVLICGTLYYLLVRFAKIGLPCLFHEVTSLFIDGGLQCPGCGVSRMLIAISKFDFRSAFYYNKALFVTLPVIMGVFLHYEVNYIVTGSRALKKWSKLLLMCIGVLLIAFGIMRNII